MALDYVQGLIAVLIASICYGSYFVPAKKYEVHDGLIFQWYQCSGITLAGMFCALLRNDWSSDGEESFGFYVCPEGVLMGVLFQVANILATRSVKMCGLGVYYTLHQVTNLGLTFIVGIFGCKWGLPATPPGNVWLALGGFCLVMLGMVPVMYMEKEKTEPPRGTAASGAAQDTAQAAEDTTPLRGANVPSPMSLATPNRQDLSALFPEAAPNPERTKSRPMNISNLDATPGSALNRNVSGSTLNGAGRVLPPRPVQGPSLVNREFNSRTWDGTLGRPQPPSAEPAMAFLGNAFVVKESPDPSTPGSSRNGTGVLEEQLLPADDWGRWWWGVGLSLVAGALYAAMYIPLLPWKARMKERGITVQGFDSFWPMCVGLYVSSTAYLLIGGAFMRYHGKRVEKSVLRPALLSGLIYGGGAFSFLWAMMELPYAVGYAMGVGGGLAVSLMWSTLVFGEASTDHNRKCVLISFFGELTGIIVLGLSA